MFNNYAIKIICFIFFLEIIPNQIHALTAPLPKDQHDLLIFHMERLVSKAKSLVESIKSQDLKVTNFTGWEAEPILNSLINAYLLTKDKKYLIDFMYFSKDFVSYKADNHKTVNFEGKILPQWYRIERYNIFHVSPYFSYPKENTKKIMQQRGWKSLKFSDVNHDGLFLVPLLRFCKIVKEYKLKEFEALVDEIIISANKTIESHDTEWIDVEINEGYYIFPKECPFFLDSIEMPINEASIFGSALILMYELTNEEKYLNRAKKMANHWLKSFSYDENGCAHYPYVTGAWHKGWTTQDALSINTPAAEPNLHEETFHKASITIRFFNLLKNHYAYQDLKEALVGLEKSILYSVSLATNQISFFPDSLSFSVPQDSFHTQNPASQSEGWSKLARNHSQVWNKIFLMSYVGMIEEQSIYNVTPYLDVLANRPQDMKTLPLIKVDTITIVPYLEKRDIKSNACLFEAKEDTVVHISFKHSTPKHNRLFLLPTVHTLENGRGIRLEIENGVFSGFAYLKKGDCVNWFWNNQGGSPHALPSSKEENKLTLKLYTISTN